MSSDADVLIRVKDLSKTYQIYSHPSDRLKQLFFAKKGKKYYKEFYALQNIDFEVTRGTSMGVIGKNGAGKSTLLQLITGTLSATEGSVEVNGKLAAVLELGAGFNPEFSGRENIVLYCNLFRMTAAEINKRFDSIVDFSELSEFIDQPIKTYSSGMIARLAFSVIAHLDADILIIDEALSVGDASFSQKCMRFLRDFRESGSIFFVSHDISAVKSFCESAVWLDNGVVRAIGDSKSVCDQYLAEIYPNAETVSSKSIQKNRTKARPLQTPLSIQSDSLVKLDSQQLKAFRFNPSSTEFGNLNAEIVGIQLSKIDGETVEFCDGYVAVQIVITIIANTFVESPVVGFFIKDRLGQPLFGANTYLKYQESNLKVNQNGQMIVSFDFDMPILMKGDYSVSAAIATGTLENHTQLHWLHDGALFKVTESTLDGVLVGIPMRKIEFLVKDND